MASDRSSAATRLLTRPLYLQVRDALIERIGKGEWRPGAAIPNEVDLAREFGISSGTMRKALDQLEAERAVTRRQGRGTFVADQSSDAHRFSRISGADGKPMAAESRTVEIVEAAANEEECRRLRLRPHDQVYRVRCVHLAGKLPFMVAEASLPAALFPGLLDKKDAPYRVAALAQQHGLLLGKAAERISMASAPTAVAAALHIQPGTPVMLLDRLLLTLDGQAVEWRIAHCNLTGGLSYLAEMS